MESTPGNATHWSTRAMARPLGLSQSTVSRICRAIGPAALPLGDLHAVDDPYFVDMVHDVVGLSMNCPSGRWCSTGEKTQIGRRRYVGWMRRLS